MPENHSIPPENENQETSEWHNIPGYDGYFVQRSGLIGSEWRPTKHGAKKTGKIHVMKLTPRGDGYIKITLCRDGMHDSHYVHRLVASVFLGPCPDGLEVCHNDGNKSNNSITNLRYDTRRSNAGDRIKHGTGTRGEKHNTVKLTREQVYEIRLHVAKGMSVSEIAEMYGLARGSVYGIISGQSWGWLK